MSESINLANAFITLVPSMAGSQGTITKELTNAVVGPADKAGLAGGAALGGGVLSKAKKVLGPAAVGAALAGVGTGLYKIGETFDDMTDNIRIGTGASGEDLESLVDSAKLIGRKIPVEFDKIGGAVADVNTRYGMSGETLETVASQYLEASRILGEDVDINKTSAAFSAFKIEGDDVIGAMDTLFQVSQATGVGMNELASGIQKNAPAVQALGFDFEETAAMVGSLDKAGLNSTQVMASMSKSLVTLAKDGEDPKEAFERVTGELQGFIDSGDEAAALDLAGKVFGTRGAPQFLEAIQTGTLSLEGMMDAVGATSDTILATALETDDFAEKWQLVKNNALVALEPLGSAVFDALGDALGAVIPYLDKFGDWLQENPGTIKILGGILGGLAVALGIAAAAQWAMNSALLASPVTWIIVGVAAIGAAIVLLWKNWDKVWGWIKDKFGVVVDFFKDKWAQYGQPVIDAIGKGFDWLWESVISPVIDWITGAWDTMATALQSGWDWIDSKVFAPMKKGAGWLSDKFTAVKVTIKTQWDTMKSNLKAGWDWIDKWVFKPIKKGAGWVSDKFTAIKTTISDQWDTMTSNLQKGWDWLDKNVFTPVKDGAGWVADKFEVAKTLVSDQWDTMKENLKKGWDWIDDKVFTPVKDGVAAVGEAFEKAKDFIDEQWTKVKSLAATPINFVIEKVYTGGIKKLVEKTAEKLGLSISLPTVNPIKLNRGGRLAGFGGGDIINAMLEPGEFIVNKFASAKYHPLLAAINSTGGGGGYGVAPGTVGAAMSSSGGGCGSGGCGLPGYAKGGWLAGVGEWFKDKAAGIGEFLKDPLAAVAELITKPVTSMLGDLDRTVWADLGKGGVKTVLGAIPNWFKKKSEDLVPPGTGGPGLVGAARKALGVPYVWGGSSIPPGLDCSGLVYWAARQMGLGWPRLTAAGYQAASQYKTMSNATPGDLLYWGNPAHHVAIYTGPGQMVHAPVPGDYVRNAGIYGSPTVGSYGGGGGTGLTSTYAGLVSHEAAQASSADDLARRLRYAQYDSGGLLRPGYTLAYNGTGKNETIRTAEQEAALGRGQVVYNDNRRIYNPVAEPDSIQVGRNLQRAAAGVGALV